MTAHISQIEYHVIKGGSQFDEAVDWQSDKQDALDKCKALNLTEPGHNVFEVTSYLNDYEQIT